MTEKLILYLVKVGAQQIFNSCPIVFCFSTILTLKLSIVKRFFFSISENGEPHQIKLKHQECSKQIIFLSVHWRAAFQKTKIFPSIKAE